MEIFRKRLADLPVTETSYITASLTDLQSGELISQTELFLSNFIGITLRNPNLTVSRVVLFIVGKYFIDNCGMHNDFDN